MSTLKSRVDNIDQVNVGITITYTSFDGDFFELVRRSCLFPIGASNQAPHALYQRRCQGITDRTIHQTLLVAASDTDGPTCMH
jgi:hypothetical protein